MKGFDIYQYIWIPSVLTAGETPCLPLQSRRFPEKTGFDGLPSRASIVPIFPISPHRSNLGGHSFADDIFELSYRNMLLFGHTACKSTNRWRFWTYNWGGEESVKVHRWWRPLIGCWLEGIVDNLVRCSVGRPKGCLGNLIFCFGQLCSQSSCSFLMRK